MITVITDSLQALAILLLGFTAWNQSRTIGRLLALHRGVSLKLVALELLEQRVVELEERTGQTRIPVQHHIGSKPPGAA